MCIRDHNAWLASNWFPIPGAGLGRPRGTRARAYERSESGALYTRREYSFQVLGSDRNWIVQPASRWNHVSLEEHSIITRPRGDFDACIGELVARLLVRVSTDARFIGRRVFIERPRVYETYVPSIRSLSFSLFFFFLEKVGLRPTRFFVLFYREYTVFKWTSISISTNLAFRLEVFGILDRWFLYLYSCLYLYILNNYAKRDIWSGDRIGIVEEFCGKKRWIQDF